MAVACSRCWVLTSSPCLPALHPLTPKPHALQGSALLLTVLHHGVAPVSFLSCPRWGWQRLPLRGGLAWSSCPSPWVLPLPPVGCTILVKEYSLNLKFCQVLNEFKIVINILLFFFHQDSKGKKDESIVNFKNTYCCRRNLIMLEAFEPISRSNKTWLILVTSVSSWFNENEFFLPPHMFNYAFNLSIQSCQVSTLVKSGEWSYGF